MSAMILNAALIYAQIAIALAACLACIRAVRGPRAQDRVIGLDTIYVCVMLLFLTTGMRIGSDFFFEAAMVVGVMGFVATVAMGKFLLRGEVIE